MSSHYTVSGEGPKLIATFSTLTTIATVAIALRIYVRGWMIKSFGIDDWTAVFGWLAYVGLSSTAMASTRHGFGQHANLIHPRSEIEIGLRLTWSSELLYATSNMLIKLSIFFALLRFVIEQFQRNLLYMVIASTSVSSIIFLFVFIFRCSPISFFWTKSQEGTHGKCLNPVIVVMGTYIYSVISVLCDWTMAVLPYILVRRLQMGVREKFLVVFVLAMGSVLSRTGDLLYEITGVAIWSACETGLGLFASCVATLRPLLKNSCVSRPRAGARQDSSDLSAVPGPSKKIKRPRLPWSELLDTNGTECTMESSYASTNQTAVDSRQYRNTSVLV